MRFIAVFKSGAVSLPYPSFERLRDNNDFRWNTLYKVVSAENESETNRLTTAVLHELFVPFACACKSCQDQVLKPLQSVKALN